MAEINLKNMYTDQFEKLVNEQMQAPIKFFERELATVRVGRAHTSMVEDIKVTCYGGSQMTLKELAALSAPEPRMILIQPWDKSIIGDIEKAIQVSSLGITPANDGNLIRLQLPEVSSQRRDELVKALHKKLEDVKERIRVIRNELKKTIQDAQRKHDISDDFSKTLQELLQKVTDKYNEVAQQMSDKKEKDVRAI